MTLDLTVMGGWAGGVEPPWSLSPRKEVRIAGRQCVGAEVRESWKAAWWGGEEAMSRKEPSLPRSAGRGPLGSAGT